MKTIFTLLAVVALALPSLAQNDDAALLVRARKIYLGDGKVIEGGAVLVKNGKIVAVGPAREIEVPAGTTRIRAYAVTAGFIDGASTNTLGGGRTPQESEIVPAARVLDVVDLNSKSMKRLAVEGVTSVYVSASNESVIGPRGTVVKTGEGARKDRVLVKAHDARLVLKSGPQFGNTGPRRPNLNSEFTRAPLGPMGTVLVARDAFMKAKQLGPESKDVHSKYLADVLAGKKTIRVAADQQYQIAAALRFAREFSIPITLEGAPQAWRMAGDLAATKTPVVFGPIRQLNYRAPRPFGFGIAARAKERRRFDAPKILIDKGVTVALTSGGQWGDYGLARQAMFAMRYGLSRQQALAAITTTPAKLLGISDRTGSIAVGKDADLVVWSGEPLDATSRIERVVLNGRIVKGSTF